VRGRAGAVGRGGGGLALELELTNERLEFVFWKESDERLSNARAMHWSTLPDPRVHPDALTALDLVDVNNLAPVKDGEVDRLAGELPELDEKGLRFVFLGRDTALHGLPGECAGQARRKNETPEGHEPPVLRLHASGPDTLVPELGSLLVGRDGFGGCPVSLDRSSEEHGN
jgi:hypothetical protein